jgi:hypothetical protein
MTKQQAPSSIFMVRPASFGYNDQTADSNLFQQKPTEGVSIIHETALKEFDAMVQLLIDHQIDVHIFDDTTFPYKPDAIFPNNWISLHEEGKILLYPMLTANRRAERRADIINTLKEKFVINEIVNFAYEELSGKIVEGTGSLVFDHVNNIVYANRSQRTSELLVKKIAAFLAYDAIIFDAQDEQGNTIYHTNVVMCIGDKFAVVCLDAIVNDSDQEMLLSSFAATSHKVIAISYAQMRAFAGNMLEVRNNKGECFVLLSQSAFNILLPGQLDALTRFVDVLPINIPTIETYGGGSVRCMVAGIHAPKR